MAGFEIRHELFDSSIKRRSLESLRPIEKTMEGRIYANQISARSHYPLTNLLPSRELGVNEAKGRVFPYGCKDCSHKRFQGKAWVQRPPNGNSISAKNTK